tara:strand:+ start:1395 stop:2867 length:1473 start_codon:yes stop_codon:yes gene_type:complete
MIGEECAIIGYYCINNKERCCNEAIDSLNLLQHRGRETSGISAYCDETGWNLFKGVGLVEKVFENYNNTCAHNSIIGHNRYSTSAKKVGLSGLKTEHIESISLEDSKNTITKENLNNEKILIQPFYSEEYNFSMVHNGNIQNVPYDQNDSKYLFDMIVELLSTNMTMRQAMQHVLLHVKGIYNVIIQTSEGLYLMRDRFGVRPFYYAFKTDNIIVCGSESVAFGSEYKKIKEVGCGELIYIGSNCNVVSSPTIKPKYVHKLYKLGLKHINPSFCIFELFYFMNHHSKIDDSTLYDIRFKFGTLLAKNDVGRNLLLMNEDTIVVGSPNSGIAAGEGYALSSGYKYAQCIKKTEGVGRTFILPTDEERQTTCKKAFSINAEAINNKNIIIVDDTIVRGNTFKSLIEQIREIATPKSIHVRIASPKIIDVCNLGIDLPTREELVVHKTDNIEKYLNVDSILFLSLEEINTTIGKDNCTKICGCFEGGQKYNDW